MTGAEIAIIAVTVASAAATAYSAYSASQAQSDAARYNKRVAENQATASQQAAALEEETFRERQRRFQGEQRAALGMTGVTDEGSPLLVMADTARQAEREAQLIRYGGQIQSTGFQAQAGLESFYQRTYRQSAVTGAGVSLLSSGARIGARYYPSSSPSTANVVTGP